jgi:hypothetical protein
VIRASGKPAARAADRLIDRRLTQEQLREQARTDGIVTERRARAVVDASTLPTRALSLTWPWPFFMLELPQAIRKTVENRRPGFSHKSFRGECWVHVTKPKSKQQFYDACAFAMAHGVSRDLLPSFESPQIGHIIGRWDIVDLLPIPARGELPDRWRMEGQMGFVVENARLVAPVRCGGALGFWTVPPAVLAELGRTA